MILKTFFYAAMDSGILTEEQEETELNVRDRVLNEEIAEAMQSCRDNGKIDMEEELVLQVVRDDTKSAWTVWRLADQLDVLTDGLLREYLDWKGNLNFDTGN